MKARIKSNGKIVEVISRFMPRKRNAASRDWVCNLSDGTCIDESQLEYIEESIDGLDEVDSENPSFSIGSEPLIKVTSKDE